ncbi:MAG: hypothetical protein GX316_00030 [Firmicutes bacterium]|nr:hypothetical protein [Bacillota bacterium]
MGKYLRLAFILILALLTGYGVLVTVAELPPYGADTNLTYNQVSERYINGALEDTGVPNMVTAIVLDYRAYDTMFETIVLFTAVIAVLITLKGAQEEGDRK